MNTDMRERGQLSRAECLRLLGTASVGRVVFTSGALPAVEPVHFTLDDGRIVFRAWKGPELVMKPQGTVVAFQVDAVHDATGITWSVTVVGTARILDDFAASKYRADGMLPLRNDHGSRDEVVAIDVDLVNGYSAPRAA